MTGWVRHPDELNTYFDFMGAEQAAKLVPNTVRFQVIFDASSAFLPETILGISHFEISVQPD